MPVTNIPLKVDLSTISDKASLRSGGFPSVTVQSPPDELPVPIVVPMFQAILVLIAVYLHYLRVHHIFLLKISLSGWVAPPECIIFCIIIVVLATPQRLRISAVEGYMEEKGV
jgi:hypothetical protein